MGFLESYGVIKIIINRTPTTERFINFEKMVVMYDIPLENGEVLTSSTIYLISE